MPPSTHPKRPGFAVELRPCYMSCSAIQEKRRYEHDKQTIYICIYIYIIFISKSRQANAMNSLFLLKKRTSFSRLQVCSSPLFPPRRSDMKNLRFFTSFQVGSTPILGNPCGVGCCPQWEAVMNIYYMLYIYIYIFVWLSMYVIDIHFFRQRSPQRHVSMYMFLCEFRRSPKTSCYHHIQFGFVQTPAKHEVPLKFPCVIIVFPMTWY
jgi:hypothetical protein